MLVNIQVIFTSTSTMMMTLRHHLLFEATFQPMLFNNLLTDLLNVFRLRFAKSALASKIASSWIKNEVRESRPIDQKPTPRLNA